MAGEERELGAEGFRVVRVGYDPGEVDEYLRRLESGDVSVGEPVFSLVRRGFHTGDVDAYVEWLWRTIGS